jgi:hypothetical protein
MESVYSAVRTGSLNKADGVSFLEGMFKSFTTIIHFLMSDCYQQAGYNTAGTQCMKCSFPVSGIFLVIN